MQAEGSINAKGKLKITDKKTGMARWIDAKHGLVRGPDGNPVKGN